MLSAKLRTLCALTTLVPITLAGTQAPASATAVSRAAAGPTLTIAVNNDIAGWGPDKAQGSYQAWPYVAIYDPLVRCGVTGNLEPGIATSWTFPSNTVFTAHIRPGMKFSDGTPVDAAAVKAQFVYNQSQPLGPTGKGTHSPLRTR